MQTTQTADQTIIGAPQGSILDIVARAWAEGQAPTVSLRPTVRIGSVTLIPVAIDNGNDALKGAALHATTDAQGVSHTTLRTVRIPTAFAPAEQIQGTQEITYTCEGMSFWTGETALRHQGGSLRIGPTRQRLDDDRQRWFIGAGIVELLRTAGYEPGEYQIALCLAVPNTEIIIEGDDAKPTVEPRTLDALTRYLKGKVWEIGRTDDETRTTPETWTIRVATVLPLAQTAGTVVAVTRAPNGRQMLNLDAGGMRVIDIGGGDLHVCEVSFKPSRMINRRPGDGTIRIAKALRNDPKFTGLIRGDVEAQQALVGKQVMKSGRWVNISADVARVVASNGQEMLADVLGELRDSRQFVTITGGGVRLLNGLLTDVLAHEAKQAGQDYLLVDGPLSSLLNVIGALFGLIHRAAGK
ncbi:hypothetical protein K2Z83_27705 [Oscillochloris sp. ZM17-4]|uniref:hypothetical protein n=1 Tax=Oscillochloris sp. ZM17-4 TaxID=2866714 RepID=UPI001C7330B5|nr:hypothetical protein [Oscillochloris sp. ZM17-4]MBX0331443.1 hypothetical protein [Oscillochloris sp. ZM17-4]